MRSLIGVFTIAGLCASPDARGGSFTVGVGFTQLTNSAMREHATDGVGWECRFATGTKHILAYEVSYTGASYSVEALGLPSDVRLLGTDLELVMKLQFPIGRFVPYAIAGVGWGYYRLSSTATASSEMGMRDNVVTYPVGTGLALRFGQVVVDTRVTLRNVDQVDLLPTPRAGLESWTATLGIGVEY